MLVGDIDTHHRENLILDKARTDFFDVFESSNSNSRSHIDDERTIKRARKSRFSGSIDGIFPPKLYLKTVFRVHTWDSMPERTQYLRYWHR
jgi:hypothetical protein